MSFLDDNIKSKLYDYQINHTNRLIKILKTNNSVLDASDTGTGKTYCSVALCKQLNLQPFIICPKSVIYNWESVCASFGVKPLGVVNYETIKSGKYYVKDKREICPYLDVIIGEKLGLVDVNWKIPDNCVFIFDEVHKCSNMGTDNSILLYSATKTKKPMMLLSATIADKPWKFLLFTYVLKFIDPSQVEENNTGFKKYIKIMTNWIFKDKKPMVRIHHMLYPERASRIRIDDLGDAFPETQISADPYYVSDKRRVLIEIEYKKIAEELDKLRDQEKKDDNKSQNKKANFLVKMLRHHQKIEMLKVSLFIELTRDFLDNGFSVVIFVNFTQTLKTLAEQLDTNCLIYGEQTAQDRKKNIENFMNNKKKVIICNIKAGGVGVSLHDIKGDHPRVALLSPTWNSIDLVQALGRVHRAGGQSKSIQRIVYIAKTVEEKISLKVKKKLKYLNSINNGDLDLTNIDYSKEEQKYNMERFIS
uniref:Helicase n=1 Tax=viral metagenome TaxID=1070528 RepID=A0A6C0AD06_9ZZZZ